MQRTGHYQPYIILFKDYKNVLDYFTVALTKYSTSTHLTGLEI